MVQIPWLDPVELGFPPVDRALKDPDGLLAVGGDLSIPRLLTAYRRGIFPWYEAGQPILWWSPDPRTVLLPRELHVSRSLRKQLRKEDYRCTTDRAFGSVIERCASLTSKRPGTWITAEMKAAYIALHEEGWAHSVEVWSAGQLVGGLYGVALGKVFYGESMFSAQPSASKVALCALCEWLTQREFQIIDCQVGNPYLTSMGAREMSRSDFQSQLRRWAVADPLDAGRWDCHWSSSENGAKMAP